MSISDYDSSPASFDAMGLAPAVRAAVARAGYETPSAIQAQTIGPMLAGRDVLGQAQTGTGKTAAFALPILSRLAEAGAGAGKPRVLVLAPTRELAMQVAAAFDTYGASITGFSSVAIYGGAPYGPQLTALKRGVDVVVATPGRVIDHLKRGSLDLSALEWLVLDEADEMLRMGFIDDVAWIFDQAPAERQVALFSATMPGAIRKIAAQHMQEPVHITVAAATGTADNIRQRYWIVGRGVSKSEALARLLEAEPYDAMIVFARTKKTTETIAEEVAARGIACAALNGDVAQAQRERVVAQVKSGQIDVIVATDVAARGLDVERISHVINFDMPADPESYIHRIGRTGRAGRAGDAILFATAKDKGRFKAIERATRQSIEPMDLPTPAEINARHVERFNSRLAETLASDDLSGERALVADLCEREAVAPIALAAALARLAQGDRRLYLGASGSPATPAPDKAKPKPATSGPMRAYRIEIGRKQAVAPGHIVGAIINESGLDNAQIGRIDIRDAYTLLELPGDLPEETLAHLKTVAIGQNRLGLSVSDEPLSERPATRPRKKMTGLDARGKKPRHAKSAKAAKKKKTPTATAKRRVKPAGR